MRADRQSGRAAQGYACNLRQAGHWREGRGRGGLRVQRGYGPSPGCPAPFAPIRGRRCSGCAAAWAAVPPPGESAAGFVVRRLPNAGSRTVATLGLFLLAQGVVFVVPWWSNNSAQVFPFPSAEAIFNPSKARLNSS